jgi:hypothetical protein
VRWQEERWIKLYTRDTGDWLFLSFDAQALFLMLLRKVDRHGSLSLGRRGPAALAPILGHENAAERIGTALNALLEDGCVTLDGETLSIPNFGEAQESVTSPSERKRRFKELHNDGNAVERKGTRRNAKEREGTNRTEQNRTEQNRTEQNKDQTEGGEPVTAPAAPLSPLLEYLAAEFPLAMATEANEKAWAAAFPGVDLLAESKKARRWELDNPTRIKTGKRRFLGNWFERSQNSIQGPARSPGRSGAANLHVSSALALEAPGRKVV